MLDTSGSIVVTGPQGGMTLHFIESYYQKHPDNHLVLLVRDPSKVLPSLSTMSNCTILRCDLSDLSSVRQASQEITDRVKSGKLSPIECLVESAAVQVCGPNGPRITQDGYEETVAVNHLAHFILTLDLLPSMKPQGRIVIVGSDSHRPNYKFIKIGPKYKPIESLLKVEPGTDPSGSGVDIGMARYSTSKLLQMMTGHELARRLKTSSKYKGIHVVMFNPGSMGGTGLFRDRSWIGRVILGYVLNWTRLLNWLDPALMASRKEDSAAVLERLVEDPSYALTEPIDEEGQTISGVGAGAPYFDYAGNQASTLGEANEQEKCEELWRDSATLLGYSGEKALI
ncbi:hypothetical protein BD324DRAFT_639029 [Kockovaella imperatae]|uniref:Short-chain dehydrogenase n=1 Tax=Kockovaella imperatae TaxID=4999 RepID=A0A1Y1U977_9TREE|nr:hypothetical protein BD324DRAFT_639029 [Kockovaella imperatae]ORX33645.1 hypothetical protein BD324DRAFT_639029 [Kockovaella imperatae]